jgi:hypothetical protein
MSSQPPVTPLVVGAKYNVNRPLVPNGQTGIIQGDSQGAQLINTGFYLGDLFSIAKSVTTTASTLIGPNTNRTYLSIQNQDATNAIFIKPDGTAAANGGSIRIGPLGEKVFENGFIPRQWFSAISSTGTVVVNVTEGI